MVPAPTILQRLPRTTNLTSLPPRLVQPSLSIGPYKLFFSYCCIGAEVFYISLYMWANATGPVLYQSKGPPWGP